MRLLVVEDDKMIGESVVDALRSEHHAVDWVRDGAQADAALRTEDYDLLLLDLGLPKLDGLAVLRALRGRKQTLPVLIATARDAVQQRIEGLDAGADDYLLKPYDTDELLARIRALLRRAAGRAEPIYQHAGVSINPATHEVSVKGTPVQLSAREWAVLEPLLARPGLVLSRAQLEEKALRLGRRNPQQRGRGLHPRPAQEARARADPQRARCRLPRAEGRALKPHSLRARLLWFILAAIVLTALLQAGVAWRTARAEADLIFDYQMQQTALALRSGLPVTAAPLASRPGDDSAEQNFEFVVQVWSADGLRIFESASRAALPQRAQLGFTTVRARGSSYRVYSMATPTRIIQVAQDMRVRRSMAGTLALRTALPIALLAPLLMLAVWWVVSASMAPVTKVQRQLALRRADALDPIVEQDLPAEIEPLVTELNALLGRVGQAFDAQSRFVADAAHELRSPLAALKLQAQALQRAGDESTRTLAAGRLTAGIDRATRLVEQLLVLARQQALATAGGTSHAASIRALAVVDLSDLVRQGIADAAEDAEADGIDVGATTVDEVALPGHADALRMLLRNLLDNALRHTPAGGRIDVALRHDVDGAVRLTVEDSGPGIAESERTRVLDRFYRIAGEADWSGGSGGSGRPSGGRAARHPGGSGLGLAIVKSITDLHGATLTLERSTTLGGLRVAVRFSPTTAPP